MDYSDKPLNNNHRDLTEVKPYDPVNPNDVKCFSIIYNVLEAFGYTDRFGICLLHKHFDIDEDEVIVEGSGEGDRSTLLEVIKRNTEDMIPSAYALKNGTIHVERGCSIIRHGEANSEVNATE